MAGVGQGCGETRYGVNYAESACRLKNALAKIIGREGRHPLHGRQLRSGRLQLAKRRVYVGGGVLSRQCVDCGGAETFSFSFAAASPIDALLL